MLVIIALSDWCDESIQTYSRLHTSVSIHYRNNKGEILVFTIFLLGKVCNWVSIQMDIYVLRLLSFHVDLFYCSKNFETAHWISMNGKFNLNWQTVRNSTLYYLYKSTDLIKSRAVPSRVFVLNVLQDTQECQNQTWLVKSNQVI